MKKLLALTLAAVMTFSLVGCGSSSENSESKDSAGSGNASSESSSLKDADLANYPENFDEWTGQDILDYFTEIGVFTNEEWAYLQTGEETAGTGFAECASYMSMDDDSVYICIFYFDPNASDASLGEEHKQSIIDNGCLSGELSDFVVDHLVGNFAFSYSLCEDDGTYDLMDEGFEKLCDDMNLTPEV